MSDLRGKVVLVDFWTYTCINCIRTLPYLEAWQQRYGNQGFTVVGVHSPEFPFEKDAGNVQAAIRQNHLTYPVVAGQRPGDLGCLGQPVLAGRLPGGRAGQRPRRPLRRGRLRADRAGDPHPAAGGRSREPRVRRSCGRAGALCRGHHPETYLGATRAQGWVTPVHPATRTSAAPPSRLSVNQFAYSGHWGITDEDATAGAGARIDMEFNARRVFLVLGSPDQARHVQVLLDGKPIPAKLAGDDVQNGRATIQCAAPLSPGRPAGGLSSTASPWSSTRASPATRSRSGRPARRDEHRR